MTRTTYRNFLASEMYLAYIQSQQVDSHSNLASMLQNKEVAIVNYLHHQVGPESDFSPKHSDSHSTESSLSGRGGGGLPIADDSGHFSGPAHSAHGDAGGERSKSGASTRPPTSLAPEGSTSGSTSGVSESSLPAPLPSSSSSTSLQPNLGHNNTLVSASAQPSRDVTTGEGDSLVEESAPAGQPVVQALQTQSHSALPTLHEDSELDCQVNVNHPARSRSHLRMYIFKNEHFQTNISRLMPQAPCPHCPTP